MCQPVEEIPGLEARGLVFIDLGTVFRLLMLPLLLRDMRDRL